MVIIYGIEIICLLVCITNRTVSLSLFSSARHTKRCQLILLLENIIQFFITLLQDNWHTISCPFWNCVICWVLTRICSLIHHHKQDTEHSHQPHKFSCAPLHFISSSSPIPRQPLICFLPLYVHISRILHKWNHTVYTFKIWILSLSIMMILRFISVVCISNWLLFMAEYVWIYHGVFNHLSIDGHLSCLHCWAITKKAAVKTYIQDFK